MEIIILKYSNGLISALPDTFNYIKKYNKNLSQIYIPNAYKPYPKYKKKTSFIFFGLYLKSLKDFSSSLLF